MEQEVSDSEMKNDRDVNAEDGPSLEQMAHPFYDIIGRFFDKVAPAHVKVWPPLGGLSLLRKNENEYLRFFSSDEIAHLLRPL